MSTPATKKTTPAASPGATTPAAACHQARQGRASFTGKGRAATAPTNPLLVATVTQASWDQLRGLSEKKIQQGQAAKPPAALIPAVAIGDGKTAKPKAKPASSNNHSHERVATGESGASTSVA